MLEISKKWFVATWFFCFCLGVATSVRSCCPQSHLIEKSEICSDNKTKYNLNCEQKAMLLDPSVQESDKFSLKVNGTLLVFDGDEAKEDEFCLGQLKKNGSNTLTDVALVCFKKLNELDYLYVIHRLLMVISILFLLLTLYVYSVLPNLRDLQGKCVIAFICTLTASFVTLLVTQTFTDTSKEVCITQAAVLYFFMSSCFFWNNVLTFNIWKGVRKITFKLKDKSWAIIYVIWGFGAPLIMVLVSFVLEHFPVGNHLRPSFGETRCWFQGEVETWSYFYGPISVLLILNTLMFLQSCWILWRSYRDSSHTKIRSLRFKFVMYLKLFLLMGITWVFEVISYATKHPNTEILWFITDCLNCSQGIIIFLILVVFRQKVRRGLLDQKVLNIKWPQSWGKEEILEESSTMSLAEELELAHQKTKFINESQKGNGQD